MNKSPFPRMLMARQKFPPTAPLEIRAVLEHAFESQGVLQGLKPGAQIAVAVGSRGITNLADIVAAVLRILQAAGAKPFIVPAMGSHGGATAEGQCAILAGYGITEELGVPIKPSMGVEFLGLTPDGVEAFLSREALHAEGIVVVNRIKPHTDFDGPLGSGILKMIAVGLGKRSGAVAFHAAASRLGYGHVLRSLSQVILAQAPFLGGVAIIENQRHETARLEVLKPERLESAEANLLAESRNLMPQLPYLDIDLLIVDRLGKNVSGTGMDPNVIGRSMQGYSSALYRAESTPFIRRIFVRELTPETHGNAIGIGLADFTTARLVHSIDLATSYLNSLTALTIQSVKIPIHFATDREAITQALASLGLADSRQAKVVRIQDTLALERLEVSESCVEQLPQVASLELLSGPREMSFDPEGNLMP